MHPLLQSSLLPPLSSLFIFLALCVCLFFFILLYLSLCLCLSFSTHHLFSVFLSLSLSIYFCLLSSSLSLFVSSYLSLSLFISLPISLYSSPSTSFSPSISLRFSTSRSIHSCLPPSHSVSLLSLSVDFSPPPRPSRLLSVSVRLPPPLSSSPSPPRSLFISLSSVSLNPRSNWSDPPLGSEESSSFSETMQIRSVIPDESPWIPFPSCRRQVLGLEISIFHIQPPSYSRPPPSHLFFQPPTFSFVRARAIASVRARFISTLFYYYFPVPAPARPRAPAVFLFSPFFVPDPAIRLLPVARFLRRPQRAPVSIPFGGRRATRDFSDPDLLN